MVRYFKEDTKFEFRHRLLNNRWLKMVAASEIRSLGDINIIFCSDNYILDVNMKYLQHDYFTDIIERRTRNLITFCSGISNDVLTKKGYLGIIFE